jgi:hypothetical protein
VVSVAQSADITEPHVVEKLVNALDEEADKLSPPQDETGALERLSIEGALPSDAYKISFEENFVSRLLVALPVDDRELVKTTIRIPDFQENFGPSLTPNEPSPISLFGKWFNFGRPRDRFLLIVAASRQMIVAASRQKGAYLIVHHFWRVYSNDINLRGVKSLADIF